MPSQTLYGATIKKIINQMTRHLHNKNGRNKQKFFVVPVDITVFLMKVITKTKIQKSVKKEYIFYFLSCIIFLMILFLDPMFKRNMFMFKYWTTLVFSARVRKILSCCISRCPNYKNSRPEVFCKTGFQNSQENTFVAVFF